MFSSKHQLDEKTVAKNQPKLSIFDQSGSQKVGTSIPKKQKPQGFFSFNNSNYDTKETTKLQPPKDKTPSSNSKTFASLGDKTLKKQPGQK